MQKGSKTLKRQNYKVISDTRAIVILQSWQSTEQGLSAARRTISQCTWCKRHTVCRLTSDK